MNKYKFKDFFYEPEGKIAKRMIYKSDNVIAFVLNIAKGEMGSEAFAQMLMFNNFWSDQ